MATSPVILTQSLSKSYGRVQALRGLNLEVQAGEIFDFLGPNGAGKTASIRCPLDLIRPSGGTATVLGLDPQADPAAVRARAGYLPGEMQLPGNMNGRTVLRDAPASGATIFFSHIIGKVEDLAEWVGIIRGGGEGSVRGWRRRAEPINS